MALFTDADIVTLDALLPFESSLVQVAASHAIDVDTKINLATSAIGQKLMLWLLDVRASDPQWLNRRLLGLSTVVVTPVLRRWLCFDSLSRFFAEAYNVQLNTRFEGKWTEYKQQASDAADMVFMSGVGIVYNPLPKPPMPIVEAKENGGSAEPLFIQTSWIDSQGNESALSPANGLIREGDSSVTVAVGEIAPPAATGWNVYGSSMATNLTLQNTSALSLGQTWQLPVAGLIDGSASRDGQQPNYYIALSKPLRRG